LSQVVNTLEGLVAFLPDVLAAILILLFGSLLARIIGDGLGTLAVQAGVTAGVILGQAIRYILLVFVVILALEQLGVQTTMLIMATTALITATALALALAFGIGSRELAHNIMAGFHAKEAFHAGQQVKVRGYVGRLVEVGPVKAVIETEDGLVSLPNFVLTDEEVTVMAEAGEP
jgi:small-conductance mechanosensitive channel